MAPVIRHPEQRQRKIVRILEREPQKSLGRKGCGDPGRLAAVFRHAGSRVGVAAARRERIARAGDRIFKDERHRAEVFESFADRERVIRTLTRRIAERRRPR
jgi:hypothetical protein